VAAALFLLPVADEVLGAVQFPKACEEFGRGDQDQAGLAEARSIRVEIATSDGPRIAVPVHASRRIYVDADTGKVLATGMRMTASGGWLMRKVMSSATAPPMLIDPKVCSTGLPPQFRRKVIN
jgi:hypothetical protein